MVKMGMVLVLAGTVFGFSGAGTAVAYEGCLRGSCHQDLTRVRYLHGPVAAEMAGSKGCVICHEPAGTACTATKAGVFKLKGKNLCLTCHGKGTGSQHTQELVEGKCLQCHDPHGSEISPRMLRAGRKQ